MKVCFFMGNHDTPEAIWPYLVESVQRHAEEYGVDEFVVGNRGMFDQLAARAVQIQKRRTPNISLVLLLAYHDRKRSLTPPPGYDLAFYPPGLEQVEPRMAIVHANQYMVDRAHYLIAYSARPGNTRRLLDYALKRRGTQLQVENLAHTCQW